MKITVLLLVLSVPQLMAHPGDTDKYGCHAGSLPYHCHTPKTPSYSDQKSDENRVPFKSESYEHKDELSIPIPEPEPEPKPEPSPPKSDEDEIDFIGLLIKVFFVIVIGWLISMLFTRKQPKIKPKRTIFRRLFNKTKYWFLRSKKRHFK